MLFVKAVHGSMQFFPFYDWEEAQEDSGFAPTVKQGMLALEKLFVSVKLI